MYASGSPASRRVQSAWKASLSTPPCFSFSNHTSSFVISELCVVSWFMSINSKLMIDADYEKCPKRTQGTPATHDDTVRHAIICSRFRGQYLPLLWPVSLATQIYITYEKVPTLFQTINVNYCKLTNAKTAKVMAPKASSVFKK